MSATLPSHLLPVERLDALLTALRARGFSTVGPRLRDGAIVYDEIHGADELPAGWADEQAPGHYRLRRRADGALFGYAVGPHSWKRYLFPPQQVLWRVRRDADGFHTEPGEAAPKPQAFIGVRACELHALAVQDRVFTGGEAVDPAYQARRQAVFVVAVQCTQAGGTCFCASMDCGPQATSGFDLALTELIDAQRHDFLVEVGSEAGAALMQELHPPAASPEDVAAARARTAATRAAMGREMDTAGIKELLYRHAASPHWDAVASRCVSCGNCTSVCPTCFCSDVADVTSLDGDTAERTRHWASCFSPGFTHLSGGDARHGTASRYRHWITHKLAAWQDQFGTSGCVGCGRCITWCPPGIDITEEVAALRRGEAQP